MAPAEPPAELAPWRAIELERRAGLPGKLAATWYPVGDGTKARGVVALVHPWVEWGKAYFHRRGRIEAARAAGYHVVAFDLPGFGGSGQRRGFLDRDVADGLAGAQALAPELPLLVWGVSSGGYWAHQALTGPRRPPVGAALFEDVAPHLIEWSRQMSPWGRPAFALFEVGLRRSYTFLDLRRHAPHLDLAAVAYVSGGEDSGVPAAATARLAALAGGRSLVVPGATHLQSIRLAGPEIFALATEVFAAGVARLVRG